MKVYKSDVELPVADIIKTIANMSYDELVFQLDFHTCELADYVVASSKGDPYEFDSWDLTGNITVYEALKVEYVRREMNGN